MDEPQILMIPTHPGVQYHFCRVGLPVHFLGHWDQFHYWRPQPSNVHNVLPVFEDDQLDLGPDDYAKLLDDPRVGFPERYDLAWLMFNWQFKLLRERRDIKKLYRVSKVAELDREEWDELLSRDDFTVVSFYPNTVEWMKERYGIDLPYIPLGLDPATYDGWTGEAGDVLSIIHSYRERGWHYHLYREAMEGLPTLHVDHLDPDQPVFEYADIQRALRRSRVYLHDGEQEYTITLIEAMMTGMPLVSFRIPGIERYVVHGENGFVGDTAAEIREHCQLLLSDDALAARMGAASRAMAIRDFHEERWRAQWIEAIGAYLG
ncbi:MAG: glycosyltransferase family 4 protein [Sandaracinaceae bacterium]|nr:glycosyltransferase family 4 protein [Sandaracinaceae bacterium]